MEPKAISAATPIFEALSNKIRLRILGMVMESRQPLHFQAIARNLKMDYGAVYRHISVLKSAGLVEVFEVGRSRVVNVVNPALLNELLLTASKMRK